MRLSLSLPRLCLLCFLLSILIADSAPSAFAGPPRHGKRRSPLSSDDKKNGKKKKKELQSKLNQIQGTMSEVKKDIQETKVQEGVVLESMETVEARMIVAKIKLTEVSDKIERLDGEHEKVVMKLERAQNRLNLRKGLLSIRLRDNYQRNQETYVQTLLESKSLHQMLSRSYYIRLIVDSDANLIETINSDVQQIKIIKITLEKQEREEQALEAELEQQKSEYSADLTRKRIILSGMVASRVQAESELDDLATEANSMSDRIRALSEMLRRQQEAARRASSSAAGRRPKGGLKPYSIPTAWRGGFSRPCDGPITSGFGERFHPILKRRRMHAGVDFGAGFGAPIRAAADGIVIMSGYSRGYGNCIILDHGGGVTTLYGHCSARLVHEGQAVKQGENIGKVGATGMATGPHLHFEVRRNGTPVQPY